MKQETIKSVINDLIEYVEEQRSLCVGVEGAGAGAMLNHHAKQYDYVIEVIESYEPSEGLLKEVE